MVKDTEDWHGLQTKNLKNLGLTFQDAIEMALTWGDTKHAAAESHWKQIIDPSSPTRDGEGYVKEECMINSTFKFLAFMFYYFSMDQYALENTLLVHFHCLYISWQAW